MTTSNGGDRLCATCGGRLLPCRLGDDDAFIHDGAEAAFDCAELRRGEPIRPMPETIVPLVLSGAELVVEHTGRFDRLAIDTDALGWTEPPADPTGVDCIERYENPGDPPGYYEVEQ